MPKNSETTHLKKYTVLLALIGIAFTSNAQVPNDECEFANFLGPITEYCSDLSEFDNIGATLSPEPLPFCWFNGHSHDVWFSFIPTAPAAFFQLFGQQSINDNNVPTPSMVIYGGDCNNLMELACGSVADGQGTNILELVVNNLTIGQVYYIRIDAEQNREGTFGLCIESFIPIPSPESDCPDAVVLCDKSGFFVENLDSVGDLPNELEGASCAGPGQGGEEASVWYTWTCDQTGTLTFTITPNNPNDDEEDIDFVVYRLPGGLDDCTNRESVRCMFSGRSAGNTPAQNAPCFGPTGLAEGETDTEEFAGCDNGSNNFLAPLNMVSGESYALVINNFSQSGFGFEIEFGGTGTFLGPDAGLIAEAVDAFECDKTIVFSDNSQSLTDNIVDYFWSFGVGADPAFAEDIGPHEVIYDSFGDKVIALTITSERGCTVTELVDIFVEPCCADTTTLGLDYLAEDILCAGELTGEILGFGSGGSPPYQFTLTSTNFQPSPLFPELGAGFYTLTVQDKKGCMASEQILIDEPPPIIAEAGPDVTVDLGFSGMLEGSYLPSYADVTVEWSPAEGLSCTDCLDPDVTPPGTTTYTLTVTDQNGCTSEDFVTVSANVIRPVFGPNIFTPDGDGDNDFFNIGVGPQVKSVNKIYVYDRWGNLVYEGTDVPINNFQFGWDGRFKGELVNPGVFTWIADITFIDDETLFYKGSITVIR